MALSALERLRLKVSDKAHLVLNEGVGIGDAVMCGFQTRGAPVAINTETIAVKSGGVTVVYPLHDGYSFDYDLGLITFETAPAAEAQVMASYVFTAFSDVEMLDFLEQTDQSVDGAAVLAIHSLLADGDRFIKYTLGQESADRAQARQALADLLADLRTTQKGPDGIVLADSPFRECLMNPFLEQKCNE